MSFLDRIFGRHSNEHYRRGMHAYNAGRLAEALSAFRCVLAMDCSPSDPIHSLSRFYACEAATHLGLGALEDGDPSAALALFEPAMEWNACFPALHYYAAAAYAETGAFEASGRCLRTVLQQDPAHFEARLLLAVVLHELGSPEEVQHHLARSRTHDHGPIPAFLRRLLEPRIRVLPELARFTRPAPAARQSSRV